MERPSSYAFIDKTRGTFDGDETLPSLPVPALADTVRRYIESVSPLVTADQLKVTKQIAAKFLEGGEGEKLQQLLLQKAHHARNWLDEWWLRGYHELRIPNAPLVNIGGPGSRAAYPPTPYAQIKRAAKFIYFSMEYWELLRNETLVADKGGKGLVFCMNQYRRIFNACRIPQRTCDKNEYYFKTASQGPPVSTEMLILCAGRMFVIELLHPDGTLLNPVEIEQLLRLIRDRCDTEPDGKSLGVLTAHGRDEWAELRHHLRELSTANEQKLERVQKALLVISLDDASPQNYSEMFQNGLASGCQNRWFDKFTYVVHRTGSVCTNVDHSMYEGIPLIQLTYFIDLRLKETKGVTWKPHNSFALRQPFELIFDTDNRITTGISEAMSLFNSVASKLRYFSPIFSFFGREWARKYKVHPDHMIQICLLLAYYRLHDKPAAMYETGTTRRFYRGRTETVRSCSQEAVDFCRSMMDDTAQISDKLLLFKKAMKKQNRLMKDAMMAQGCDRHIFGLRRIAAENGLPDPELFSDPSWTKSGGDGNFILSTSCTGYTTLHGGCAPMCENGYGVFYTISVDRLLFCLSHFTSSSEGTDIYKLYNNLEAALLELRNMIEQAAKVIAPAKSQL